jgi:hypothetical protein
MSRMKWIVSAVLLVAGIAACTRTKREEPKAAVKQESPAPAAVQAPAAIPPVTVEAPLPSAPATSPAPVRTKRAATRTKPAASKPVAASNGTPRPVFTAGDTTPSTESLPALPPQVETLPARPSVPAAPPRPTTASVPSGTRFDVRLSEPLSSAHNHTGDTFKAVLDRDLEAEGVVVAPAGSTVVGKIANMVEAGRVEGVARMTLQLTAIQVNGTDHPIETSTVGFDATKSTKQDAMKIGGGAGLGAIIGAIAGGGKGAAIGAAIGGAAGAGTVLATRGKPVELKAEDRITFRLEGAVTLPIVRQ